MPSITRRWKKWFAVGCSHGHLINDSAADAALRFKKAYDPDTTMHLGDFLDLAALRGGGQVSGADSAESISEDFNAGVNFLRELDPDHVTLGNHEARLYQLAKSPNAIVSHCANGVIGQINDVAKEVGAKLYPYDITKGWVTLGNHKFGHGYMFGEQAIRDHAESIGNCVIAHLHRVGEAPARNVVPATAYCLGCLADIERMHYARQRRATLAWNNGFAWGEYCADQTTVNLVRALPDGTWRLPFEK